MLYDYCIYIYIYLVLYIYIYVDGFGWFPFPDGCSWKLIAYPYSTSKAHRFVLSHTALCLLTCVFSIIHYLFILLSIIWISVVITDHLWSPTTRLISLIYTYIIYNIHIYLLKQIPEIMRVPKKSPLKLVMINSKIMQKTRVFGIPRDTPVHGLWSSPHILV